MTAIFIYGYLVFFAFSRYAFLGLDNCKKFAGKIKKLRKILLTWFTP